MILAVATVKKHISPHYAHTEHFDLYQISERKAQFMKAIPYTTRSHLESFDTLQKAGVEGLVVDMIGDETFEYLEGRAIAVYYGQKGWVKPFLHAFVEGRIKEPSVYIEDPTTCSL